MSHFKFFWGAVAAGFLAAMAIPSPTDAATKARVAANYGKLPLIFEANRGQTDARVKFLSRGPGYTLFLTESEAVLSLRGADGKGRVLRVKLLGAKAEPKMTGLARLPGVSNYFIGRDRSKWQKGVPHFARVGYEGVYPGIDLVFYGTNQRQLEYDFIVAPGADPARIKLAIEGAERLEIVDTGDLIAHLAGGEVRFKKPVIYQEAVGAKRRSIAGKYTLAEGNRIGFNIAAYDRTTPLVIDPVLEYSTYLGGTDIEEGVRSIAVDGRGDVYVAGRTRSPDFPIVGGFQQSCTDTEGIDGCHDAFVAKLDPTLSTLIYSTFLGGASVETAWGIAVDAGGNAYVAGSIDQGSVITNDFPTTDGAFQKTALSVDDAFFTKLGPTGGLLYSTYLGGSGNDEVAWDIAVDGLGRAHVTGDTSSVDDPDTEADEGFPVTGNKVASCTGRNAFVVVIDPDDGNTDPADDLVYGTCLGGLGGTTRGWAIAADADGHAYVTGFTRSDDFPVTPGAFQDIRPGGGDSPNNYDAFIAMIYPDQAISLVYASYLGGSIGQERGRAIALEPGCVSNCKMYITGVTGSFDFPTTPGAPAPNHAGGGDAFLSVIDPDDGNNIPGDDLIYSTFLGDGGGVGIAVMTEDAGGGEARVRVYLTGRVSSSSEVLLRGVLEPATPGEHIYVGVIEPRGGGLNDVIFGAKFGGTFSDGVGDIGVDSQGNAYLSGTTLSRDFPTTEGAFQTEISEEKQRGKKSSSAPPPDAFVVKIAGPFLGEGEVTPISNAAPHAFDDIYEMQEDTTLDTTLIVPPLIDPPGGVLENDSDPDGDSLTAVLNTAKRPANGTVTMDPDGNFTYTPDQNFNGTDTFGYYALDGITSTKATVTVEVALVLDDPPIARADWYQALINQTLMVSAPGVLSNDEDPDGDMLTAVMPTSPLNGTLVLDPAGSFSYTPNEDFSGTDVFEYKAFDGVFFSDPAKVTINVSDQTMHVGDLDDISRPRKSNWSARVIVTVHDGNESPLADVTVDFVWVDSFGTTGVSRCTTRNTSYLSGQCITTRLLANGISSITYTVTDLIRAPLTYEPLANHDPDGDSVIASNGTISITFKKPKK